MEKLELKHLAPYLPYGLQVKLEFMEDSNIPWYYEDKEIFTLEGMMLDWWSNDGKRDISKITPILRPMSDLGRQLPQTVVGRRYVDEINKNCMYAIDKYGDFYDLPEAMAVDDVYESFEGLFKYHFDVFNLIERGLAIDINTLTP